MIYENNHDFAIVMIAHAKEGDLASLTLTLEPGQKSHEIPIEYDMFTVKRKE